MDMNEFYDSYDEIDDDTENNGNFMFNNLKGVPIIPLFSQKYNSLLRNNRICTIFDGEYDIYLINTINENSHILLECYRNTRYKGTSKETIFDVYEYLEKSHFLNFLVAKIFKKSVWAYEGISTTIQISNTDKEKYSKIVIMIETSSVPDYVMNDILLDGNIESFSTVTSINTNTPLMIRSTKTKSYYKPIIIYDMALGFNSNSTINFNNIILTTFYNKILLDYINDALSTFYIGFSKDIIEKYGEKLLRVQYIINDDDRLMNIKLICTPSVYYSDKDNSASKYVYINEEMHLLGRNYLEYQIGKPIYLSDDISFINNISSSDVSQLITTKISECGITNEFCEEYQMSKCENIIFTTSRIIIRNEKLSKSAPATKLISNLVEIFSQDSNVVISYWKPSSPVSVNNNPNISMQIHGFINIDKSELLEDYSFTDLYTDIQDELKEHFNFTKKSYLDNKMGVIRCYETTEVLRFMVYSVANSTQKSDKVDTENKSKASRMWRAKK